MDELRLIINNPENDKFLKTIEWNKEEFAAVIDEYVRDYVGVVYTGDQLQEAKKARAELNKVKKAISDRRIEVKKLIMEPYEKFESEVKEITAKLDDAAEKIDAQIKETENAIREKKRQYLTTYFEDAAEDLVQAGVTFDHILKFDPKLLNSSYSVDAAMKFITSKCESIRNDLEVVKGECYGIEAAKDLVMNAYLFNCNLGDAITVVKQQRDIIKKAEEERIRREQAQKAKEQAEQPKVEHPSTEPVKAPVKPEIKPIQTDEKQYRASFTLWTENGAEAKAVFDTLYEMQIPSKCSFSMEIFGTKDQLLTFKDFMQSAHIRFGKGMKDAG